MLQYLISQQHDLHVADSCTLMKKLHHDFGNQLSFLFTGE